MLVYDVFNREVKIGDFVAAATKSYHSTNLRVGKVINVNKSGNISIRYPGLKYIYTKHYSSCRQVEGLLSSTIFSGKFVIIDPASLPEDFKNKLV
jgi:hypothetical protein